jgi:hypothetical protein
MCETLVPACAALGSRLCQARSFSPSAPFFGAQLAQQYMTPAFSTPWPTTRTPQFAHVGARA